MKTGTETESERRWSLAIDVLLNSGLISSEVSQAIFDFTDGEIGEDQMRAVLS